MLSPVSTRSLIRYIYFYLFCLLAASCAAGSDGERECRAFHESKGVESVVVVVVAVAACRNLIPADLSAPESGLSVSCTNLFLNRAATPR